MGFEMHTFIVKGMSIFTGAFGAAFVLFPQTSCMVFDWMMFQSRSLPLPVGEDSRAYTAFVYGVLGAVIVGWGASMYMTANSSAWQQRKLESWRAIAFPLSLWFLVDTIWSFNAGFFPNCILNVAFFSAWSAALLSCRGYFKD